MSDRVCPRCATTLETYSRPLGAGRYAITEMCIECGGLWLEEACLAETFPDLVELVRSTDRAAFSQADCPSCRTALRAFVIDGVALDACSRCIGLWVDGHEISDVEIAQQKVAKGEIGAVPAAGYRQAARRVEPVPAAPCPGCNREVSRSALVETPEGERCRLCVEIMNEPLEPPVGAFGRLWRFATGRRPG